MAEHRIEPLPDIDAEYPGRTIRHVYFFSNGLILCFDERGEQWPKFNGPAHAATWRKIKEHTCGEEKYFIASGHGWSHQINRSEFLAMAGDPGAYEHVRYLEPLPPIDRATKIIRAALDILAACDRLEGLAKVGGVHVSGHLEKNWPSFVRQYAEQIRASIRVLEGYRDG